ncbi:DUF2786 domain-containing protein [Candidatus Binatia bacterium]|nr:DUF2786 domain-containing protein [Candidatus Binatia bacterium]
MSDTKILSKIKKLLALSASSNEHEAALAAEKAHELLMEHKLSMADVEAHSTDGREEVCEVELEWGKTYIDQWRDYLVVDVARAFHCKVLRTHLSRDGKKLRGYRFIGKPTDTGASVAMQTWLTSEIERLTKESGLPTWELRWSFTCGAASTISKRIRESFDRRMREQPKYGALVVVDDHAVARYMAQRFGGKVRKGGKHARTRINADAFRQGQAAGQTVTLGGRPLQRTLIG